MNENEKNFLKDAAMGYDYCKKTKGYEGSSMEQMLSKYDLSYKKYLTEIKRIQNLCTYKEEGVTKTRFGNKGEFLEWYFENWSGDNTTCAYCGVSEKDCRDLFIKKGCSRDGKRGMHLEIERKITNGKYEESNCALICYVCNNAKSDFMEWREFEPLARNINEFWKNNLGKEIPFPEHNWIKWKESERYKK